MTNVIHVEKLVDEQKFGWFNINLLIWSFLAMFCDGFDIAVLAFAAPELVRDWGIDRAALGPAFSASLVGILFGAPFLGYVGDRYGRKTAIVAGCFIYGVFTLAIVWATSLTHIIIFRFLTGIGIGGLMPNTIALNSEVSPRRFRATLVVLMFTGITMGSSSPGAITTWLAPEYGWEVFFVVGGMVPIIVATCLLFTLPESVKYLVHQPGKQKALVKVARRIRPDLDIPDDATFEMPEISHHGGTGLRDIYSRGLSAITPLLWVCFATVLMVNFYLSNWMPLVLEANGMSPDEAAFASSIYHIGGTLGGVLISLLIDRFGFNVVVVLLVLACPSVVLVGLDGASYALLVIASTLAGIGVLGAQFGNNATTGLIYPTAFRSKGSGWAFSIGRFGAICGPLLGGYLVGINVSMQNFFIIGALPLAIALVSSIALARIFYKRFGGLQLDDKPVSGR